MRRDEGGEDEIRMRESIGKNQAPGANPGIGVALVALLAPFFFTFFSRPLIELQLSTPRGATRGTSAAGVANYFRTASFIQARERASAKLKKKRPNERHREGQGERSGQGLRP